MRLRLLEVIIPVDWVKPRIQEVLGPISSTDNETIRRQAVFILCYNKVYPVCLQIPKGLDHAIWRYNRLIDNHKLLQPRWIGDMRLDRYRRVHDQRSTIKVPEEGTGRIEGHCVPYRGYLGPGSRRTFQRILGSRWEESSVAFQSSKSAFKT